MTLNIYISLNSLGGINIYAFNSLRDSIRKLLILREILEWQCKSLKLEEKFSAIKFLKAPLSTRVWIGWLNIVAEIIGKLQRGIREEFVWQLQLKGIGTELSLLALTLGFSGA